VLVDGGGGNAFFLCCRKSFKESLDWTIWEPVKNILMGCLQSRVFKNLWQEQGAFDAETI